MGIGTLGSSLLAARHSRQGGCDHWEVAAMAFDVEDSVGTLGSGESIHALPAGWEPFAYEFPQYAIRRCAD